MPPEKLGDLIDSYIKDGIQLKEQIADICFHMAGGVDWNAGWGMSYEDREIIVKLINKRNKEKSPGGKEYL